ncbi:hypothetical protein HPB50_016394 [Hyalomma asiaticum]|uniref:Uncharacterized protein n=1 Tax=Hyalomma asiaticum TaxID=266040 RepID=A0ACB7RXT8_HYAAI|nr:hypothetical protein HPB50_016394 [Hyalomma asiaticum]
MSPAHCSRLLVRWVLKWCYGSVVLCYCDHNYDGVFAGLREPHHGCNSGYRSCKAKFSLFRAPKEPERLQKWARNMKRSNKTLDDACVVCERHIEPSFIERTFNMVVQGNVEEFPRDVSLLAKEVVASAFPDALKYLSKPLPQ